METLSEEEDDELTSSVTATPLFADRARRRAASPGGRLVVRIVRKLKPMVRRANGMRLLVALLLLAFLRMATQFDTQTDHEHLVALTSREPAVQPLLHKSRSLVTLQLEPRFTSNMRFERHGVKEPWVRVAVQVRKGGEWTPVGKPWTLKVSADYWQWAVYQKHHPGKGLDDMMWHEHTFEQAFAEGGRTGEARLSLSTNIPKPISMLIHVHEMDQLGKHRIGLALAIVLLVFGLIAFEVVHRLVAAALGVLLTLGAISSLGERCTIHQMAGWLDVDTLLLLFGMMMLVSYLSLTGVFEALAARVFGAVGRSPRKLLAALMAATAVVSAFLDNVTTILLVTPVTVHLARAVGLDPITLVIATVIASNIGGAATVVGDPPNVMIASQLAVKGVTFTRFAAHVAPAALLSLCGTLAYARNSPHMGRSLGGTDEALAS